MTIEEKIVFTLNKIRPYIQGDGGDVAFEGFDPEKGTVYIRLLGACVGCGLSDVTVKGGIEAILMDELPEVNEVIAVE